MKIRYFKIFLILISILASANVTSAEDNVYVYRNDGKFNAFLSSEIDSICYSNTGINGNKYSDPVVQEIHTRDSVYRIPLSVIDSISAQKPETKYTRDVKLLYPDYVPYIESTDGQTICISTDLPYKMNIKKGDILFYDHSDNMFENGFAGRVVSISNTGVLNIECEPVELTDIYEQFFAFGETVIEDSAIQTLKRHYLSGEIEFILDIDPIVRPLVCVRNGNVYIEVTLGISMEYEGNINLELVNQEWKKDLGSGSIPIAQPAPGIFVTIGYQNLFEAELSGTIQGELSGGCKFTRTISYDNGKWDLGENRFTQESLTPEGSFSANGSIALKTGLTVGLSTIGNIVAINLIPSIGRGLEFDITKDFSCFNENLFYDIAKESTVSYYNFGELGIKAKIGSIPWEIPITGRMKFNTNKNYLLPEFSDLEIKAEDKSLSVKTKASRNLFIPCKVGLAVLDEDGNEIDSYYEDQSVYRFDVMLDKTFSNNLSGGARYIVQPIIKLFGLKISAYPTKEVYLDAELSTGPAYATTYSVRTSGMLENHPSAHDIEVGFVYSSDNNTPTVENAKKSTGELNNNIIDGGFSGLNPGTTYYYRAYLLSNGKYYYGDTKCVTTKKNCDRSEAENIGGDYSPDRLPMADIGSAFDVEQETAKIELDYRYIHPTASCIYHLEGDDKYGNHLPKTSTILGTVTGRHTIELENLIPGTTYRFWGEIKSGYGNDISPIGIFETKPSPDPIGSILDVSEIEMESAKVTCQFDNVKSEYQCGVILSDGKWEYRKQTTPDASGLATVDLTGLMPETTYTLKTFIITHYDPEPIVGKNPKEFSTKAPDITGWWIFNTNGQAYGDPGPFDLELRENGRTNNFYGINYLHWEREGKNIFLTTPTYQTQVGGGTPTTAWEFYGRFNDDFTFCTGYVIYRNFVHDEVLIECDKPFTLVRKP